MKNKATRGTGGQKRQRPPDDPEQSKRFEETAREHGAEESGKVFEKALGIVKRAATPAHPSEKQSSS